MVLMFMFTQEITSLLDYAIGCNELEKLTNQSPQL